MHKSKQKNYFRQKSKEHDDSASSVSVSDSETSMNELEKEFEQRVNFKMLLQTEVMKRYKKAALAKDTLMKEKLLQII